MVLEQSPGRNATAAHSRTKEKAISRTAQKIVVRESSTFCSYFTCCCGVLLNSTVFRVPRKPSFVSAHVRLVGAPNKSRRQYVRVYNVCSSVLNGSTPNKRKNLPRITRNHVKHTVFSTSTGPRRLTPETLTLDYKLCLFAGTCALSVLFMLKTRQRRRSGGVAKQKSVAVCVVERVVHKFRCGTNSVLFKRTHTTIFIVRVCTCTCRRNWGGINGVTSEQKVGPTQWPRQVKSGKSVLDNCRQRRRCGGAEVCCFILLRQFYPDDDNDAVWSSSGTRIVVICMHEHTLARHRRRRRRRRRAAIRLIDNFALQTTTRSNLRSIHQPLHPRCRPSSVV